MQNSRTNPKELIKDDTISTPNTKTRKYCELSPEQEDKSMKKQCYNMVETNSELRDFMIEIKSEISMMHTKINEMNLKIDEKIDQIASDVKNIKAEMIETKAEMLTMEEHNSDLNKKAQNHDVQLNILNQLSLQNQLIMVNVATTVNEKSFLDDMIKWSGNLLKSSVENVNFTTNKTSKMAFLSFNTLKDKKDFLGFVKKKQRDENQKFIPILNEQIFNLHETDVRKANIIEFRTAMTKLNREIFNKARKAKKNNESIEGVWISKGSIRMKIMSNRKSIQLDSVEQLDQLLSSLVK